MQMLLMSVQGQFSINSTVVQSELLFPLTPPRVFCMPMMGWWGWWRSGGNTALVGAFQMGNIFISSRIQFQCIKPNPCCRSLGESAITAPPVEIHLDDLLPFSGYSPLSLSHELNYLKYSCCSFISRQPVTTSGCGIVVDCPYFGGVFSTAA